MRYVYGQRRVGKLKQKFTYFGASLVLLAQGFGVALPLFLSQKAFAAGTITVCDSGCDQTTIPAALAVAVNDDIISVSSNQVITSAITVNKDVTITSSTNATITTSGTSQVFTITASGVTISGFDFVKTDTAGEQNFIGVQAGNVTITANSFNGNWTIGNGHVVRAVLASPNQTNLVISNNNIQHVRQPAYIDGTTNGTISGNFVNNTKGWVIQSSTDLSFSGNSWGTNVLDIAIIAPDATNNYTDAEVIQMSTDNSDAVVEHQLGTKRLSDAYVIPVANGNVGDDGSKWNPYTSIQSALNRIVDGGTVHIANGNYTESFTITKNGTQLIGESKAGVQIANNGATPSGYAVDITGLSNISVKNLTLNENPSGTNAAYQLKIYQANNVTVENLALNGVGSSATPRTGGLDFNSTSNVIVSDVSIQNFSRNGIAVTAKFASGDTTSQNYSFNNISSSGNAWHGLAFYNYNGSATVSSDITGVSFSGNNTLSGNGQTGLILAGASDPTILSNGTAERSVTGPGSANLELGTLSFISNPVDILNFQTAGIEAVSAVFNGKTGNTMTAGERTAQDAKIIDKLDNASLGLVHYYDLDTTPPDVPSATLTADNDGDIVPDGGATDSQYFTFSLTSSPDTTRYQLRYWNDIVGSPFKEASPWNPTDLSGYSPVLGTYKDNFTQGEGVHYFAFSACDAAGNCSAYGAPFVVTYDHTAPAIPTDLSWTPEGGSAMASGGITNIQKGTLAWLDSDPGVDRYKYYFWTNIPGYFEGESNAWTTEGSTYITQSPTGGSIWTDFYDLQGTYYFCIKAIDATGNTSNCSDTYSVTYDTTAPSMPVHEYPVNNASLNFNDFWFEWSDATGAAKYEVQFSQNPATGGDGAFTNVQWTGDYQSIQPIESKARSVGANGIWYWQVRAVDAAGNKSAWTAPWKLEIDLVAPDIPTLVWPLNSVPINGSSPVANDWQDVAGVHHYVYQSYNVNGDGSCNLSSIRFTGDFTASETNSRVLADGLKFCWRVKAVDAAGNESAWSELWKTIADNNAPSVPVHLSPSNGHVSTTANQTLIDWEASTDASAVTYIYQSSLSAATKPDGSFVSPAYTSAPLSASEIPTPGTPEGTYYWHVKAVDSAGNESAWSAPWIIIVDNTAPLLSIAAVTSPVVASDVTPDVTASDPNAPLIFLWVQTGGPALSFNNSIEEPTFSPSVESTYSFDLTVTDAAGNSTTQSLSFDWEGVLGISTFTPSSTSSGGTTGSGGSTSNASAGSGAVLAAETEEELTNETENDEAVQSDLEQARTLATGDDNQAESDEGSSGFLGLSWLWWLLVLLGVGGLLYLLFGRKSDKQD